MRIVQKMDTTPIKKKPGVRALAKATGLSVATISRVLNNSDTVSKDTREKVQRAMALAGYRPNSAARALATNRTRVIGAVVPTISGSIFSRFLNAVEGELAMHGYALVIATSGFDLSVETKRAHELLSMGAEALILSGAQHEEGLLDFLNASNTPAICSSVSATTTGLPAIGYDNIKTACIAMDYLHGLGHSKIAIVHGPLANNDRTRLRIQGVKSFAHGHKVQLLFQETDLTVEGGTRGAARIFAQNGGETAILCLSDILALGVFFEAGRCGISIPKDVSVMGFDDLDWAAHASPSLTTIRLPTGTMGQRIAKALVDLLDNKTPVETRALDASLVVRDSTACCGSSIV